MLRVAYKLQNLLLSAFRSIGSAGLSRSRSAERSTERVSDEPI